MPPTLRASPGPTMRLTSAVVHRPASNAINRASALARRVTCNRGSSRSFHRWLLSLLDVRSDDSALDLGCGLGQQLMAVGRRVQRAVGVDVSEDLAAIARRRLPGKHVHVMVGDMARLDDLDLGGPFSLAYSVYSLYYTADPARVVKDVAGRLAGPRAHFVAVAPDVGNNAGWFADLARLYHLPAEVLASPAVSRTVILPAMLDAFPEVRCVPFRCEVRFRDVTDLMRYYDACAPYCRPDRRDQALSYFRRKFAGDGDYRISKRSLALIGRPAPRGRVAVP